MRELRALLKALIGAVRANRDLFLLWWVSVVVQPVVPTGHFLTRDDLVPWMTAALSGAALLRARPVGEGAHPQLPARRSAFDERLATLAAALAPWALASLYDAAKQADLASLGRAVIVAIAVVFLTAASGEYGRTGWNPPGLPSWVAWGALAILGTVGATLAGGFAHAAEGAVLVAPIGPAVLLGLSFFVVSAMLGRPRHLRQRRAAGRRDGRAWWPGFFRPALTLVGPALGYWTVAVLHAWIAGPVDFVAAFVGSLHVVAWAGVIWARPTPVAIQCMLHEVVPTGGKDAGDAAAFDRPPEGALRINALDLRRTRNVHPWLVPVRQARIEGLDDPVRPLWARPAPPLSAHILGEAAFEPDPDTRDVQTSEITVQLRGQTDLTALRDGDVQSRRIVVMRPWPAVTQSWRRRRATYRWEEGVPDASLQVVDAATERLSLRDGSIVVLSIEGVVRAYELEIGAPVHALPDGGIVRTPEIEDYEGLG